MKKKFLLTDRPTDRPTNLDTEAPCRSLKIKKLFQPHSGRNDMNEVILIHFGSNKAISILLLVKLRKLKVQQKLKK